MDKLKPCPFCGGKAYVDEYVGHGFCVRCTNGHCGVQPCSFCQETAEDAIAEWNRRSGGDSCD